MSNRPVGISALAVAYLLGGLFFLTRDALFWAPRFSNGTAPLDAGSLFTIGVVMAFSLHPFIASIGMWTGRSWGWWLGVLFPCLGIAGGAIFLSMSGDSIPDELAPRMKALYVKRVLWTVLHALLLLYFFWANVAMHYSVDGIRLWKRIGILAAITAGTMACLIVGSQFANALS